jgi:hypothetical protein
VACTAGKERDGAGAKVPAERGDANVRMRCRGKTSAGTGTGNIGPPIAKSHHMPEEAGSLRAPGPLGRSSKPSADARGHECCAAALRHRTYRLPWSSFLGWRQCHKMKCGPCRRASEDLRQRNQPANKLAVGRRNRRAERCRSACATCGVTQWVAQSEEIGVGYT